MKWYWLLDVEGEEVSREGPFDSKEDARAASEQWRKSLTTTIYFASIKIVSE